MNHFSKKELLHLNSSGLIPGPQEQEIAFAKRVQYTLSLIEHLPPEISQAIAHSESLESIKEIDSLLIPSLESLEARYDLSPRWVQIFFSDHKLPFWQGGCAWIFQMTEESPTSALVQLRQTFKYSDRYLGFYERKELLTHELAHVGRMMFQEPKYEEVLAYRTASGFYRRYFGPLIQSSMESALFLLLLFILVVFDVFLVAFGYPDAYFTALWLKLVPLCVLVAAAIRLWKRQRTFNECLQKLKQSIGEKHAEAVAYRLSDEEIELFAQISPQEINQYAAEKASHELRWDVILKAYWN